MATAEQITAAVQAAVNTQSTTIKIPPFWKDDPAVWFVQVEKQFEIKNIIDEATKYNTICFNLDTTAASLVRDMITTTPPNEPYTTIKTALISRSTPAKRERFRMLMNGTELGDQKPTALLREMRRIMGENLDIADFLRELFLEKLPQTTQAMLAAFPDKTIDEIAAMADEMIISKPSVFQVEKYELSALKAEINALKSELKQSKNQGNMKDQDSSTDGLCWYHARFGSKAHTCKQPCTYLGNSNTGH